MKNNVILKTIGLMLAVVTASSVSSAAVQIDGFGSFYYGQASGDVIPTTTATNQTNRNANFSTPSLLGLNLYSKMDEQFSASAQLLATGESPNSNERSYVMAIQTGYLSYSPDQTTNIQFGRLLYPHWISADYYNVGFLLPYRTIPSTTFAIAPIKSFDGINLAKTYTTGMGKLILAAFGGVPVYNGAITGITVIFKNFYGASVTMEGDGWQAKATYSSSATRFTSAAGGAKSIGEVTSLGLKYDKHNVVVWSELIATDAKDSSPASNIQGPGVPGQILEQSGGGYGLVGYRMGKWMPRYTYSEGMQNFNIGTFGRQKIQSHIVGFNYDLNPQVVGKVEYETRRIMDGAGYGVSQASKTKTGKNGSSVYAGVDFTF